MELQRRDFLKLVACAAIAANRQAFGASAGLRLRKNIASLTASELAAFRTGVGAMQALPTTDFRSWLWQSGVHGWDGAIPIPPSEASTYWNKCVHANDHFLDWHRWSLLFWEEMVRSLSGTSTFTLPYWDYLADGFLPEPFRSATVGGAPNPLYDSTRDPDLNAGTGSVSGLNTNALTQTAFMNFASGIRQNPHNAVHGAVGGNMWSVGLAARDPIFWLHHCNIDRYWFQWLGMGGGRANPNGTWGNTSFTFRETSGPRTVRAADAGTTGQLGYTYKPGPVKPPEPLLKLLEELRNQYRFIPPKIIPRPPKPGPDPGPWRQLSAMQGFQITGQPTVLQLPLDRDSLPSVEAAVTGTREEVALVLHNIIAVRQPNSRGHFIEAVLVPSAKSLQAGRAEEAVSLGTFSMFDISVMQSKHERHEGVPRIVFRLDGPSRKLLHSSLRRDPALVLLRRGLVDKNGREVKFDAKQALYKVEQLRIESHKRN